jgi:hypothetical protein
MKQIELIKAEDIFEFLNIYRKSTKYQFRGQGDSEWKLIPKAGREPFKSIDDREIFKHWKRRAFSHLENKSLNDIELLTIAQHTGLPTRLLDWTYNPLVAVFFACISNHKVDGAIFSYNASKYETTASISDPFASEEGTINMLQPNSTHSRVSNQFGYFTIHNKPTNELRQNPSMHKIIIPKEIKQDLLFIVNQLGINNMTIFPDLDGLSKHLSWFYENYKYWTEQNIDVLSPPIPSPPFG